MLILTRKSGEAIIIGNNIKVLVSEVRGTQVRLLIDAPKEIPVHREEIHNKIQEELAVTAQSLPL